MRAPLSQAEAGRMASGLTSGYGARPTAKEVEAMAEVMAKHGITELKAGDIVMVKPMVAPKQEKPEPQPSDLERLAGKSPEEQDAALRLGPLGGMG